MEILPKWHQDSFTCPHCTICSRQDWYDTTTESENNRRVIRRAKYEIELSTGVQFGFDMDDLFTKIGEELDRQLSIVFPKEVSVSKCQNCNKITIWNDKKIIFPETISAPNPNSDMGENIQKIYIEAAKIVSKSPRGAAALLRLALQSLLKQIGLEGKNINDDIKKLVEGGLKKDITKAMHLVRVIGNNAVHPGVINFDDDDEIAKYLFEIINFIADEMITNPQKREKFYNKYITDIDKEKN